MLARFGPSIGCGATLIALACGRIGYDELALGGAGQRAHDGSTVAPSSSGGEASLGSGGAGASTMSAGGAANSGGAGAAGSDASAGGGGGGTTSSGGSVGAGGTLSTGGGTGAGGGGGASPNDAGTITSVLVLPRSVDILADSTFQFSADVRGSGDRSVTWSVTQSAGGTIDSTGLYAAPTAPGVYHIVATSRADPSKRSTARIVVSTPASAATGTWQDVTPTGMSLDPAYSPLATSYGVHGVVGDPARLTDLYAFVAYQGVWRSTDYGLNWAKVSTGTNGASLEQGQPISGVIDPNPLRDQATAPTMYTALATTGPQGIWKSTDGGVSWTHYAIPAVPGAYVCSIDIDPYDASHLIATFDQSSAFVESTDAGQTWRAVTAFPTNQLSVSAFFVDTLNVETTRATWLAISAGGGTVGGQGTWRTTDGGATWTQVSTLGHGGGGEQIAQDGTGPIYTGGQYGMPSGQTLGLYRSLDFGVTWTLVSGGSANGAVATPTYIYGYNQGPLTAGVAPGMRRSLRTSGTVWASLPTPGMTNGPRHAAVTFDGTHHVIVGGNWLAGIWRYVEP